MPALKILICDDDVDIRELCSIIFKKQGWDCYVACSGVELLKMLSEVNPDLILLDVKMPDMNGIECSRKIKTDKWTQKIPVILFTAVTAPQQFKEQSLADAVIEKPFQRENLLSLVRQLTMNQDSHLLKS